MPLTVGRAVAAQSVWRRLAPSAAFVALIGLAAVTAETGAGTTPASTSGCVRQWEVVSSPAGRQQSELFAVASGRAGLWAVGRQGSDGVTSDGGQRASPLIVRRDGRWKLVRSPDVGRPSGLRGIAIAGSDAWAVGYRGSKPLIEHWNGRRWKLVPGAWAGEGALYAVAATPAGHLWAVGVKRAYGAHEDSWRGDPLIEHWNGRAWRTIGVPRPADSALGGLYAVTVVGQHVWAVGGSNFVLRWNGRRWQRIEFEFERGGGRLFGVANAGRSGIWVVGDPGIARWKNRRWQFHSANPKNARDDQIVPAFIGVVARSPSDAWAVGYSSARDPERWWPLISRWDGRRWRSSPGPFGPSHDGFTELRSIATTSATEVWSVGSTMGYPFGGRPLIERYGCR